MKNALFSENTKYKNVRKGLSLKDMHYKYQYQSGHSNTRFCSPPMYYAMYRIKIKWQSNSCAPFPEHSFPHFKTKSPDLAYKPNISTAMYFLYMVYTKTSCSEKLMSFL